MKMVENGEGKHNTKKIKKNNEKPIARKFK